MKKITSNIDSEISFMLTGTKKWVFTKEPVIVNDADAAEIYGRLSDNVKVEDAGADEAPQVEVTEETAPIVELPVEDLLSAAEGEIEVTSTEN